MLNRAKISFRKIEKGFCRDPEKTCIDMHYHSRYSDGSQSIPQIVKKARRLGIGVAITDHNDIKGAIEISKYKDVLSIPGIEVTTKEGIHILFYFYSTEELSSFYNHVVLPCKKNGYRIELALKDLLEYSKDFKTVVVAPHPFSISWMGICDKAHSGLGFKKLLFGFDAIEVLNGENLHNLNAKALKLSEKLNLSITGGSDGHTLHELGSVLTYVEGDVDPKGFLDLLRKKQTRVVGKESNMISKALSQSGKITVPVKDPISYVHKSYSYFKKVIITH